MTSSSKLEVGLIAVAVLCAAGCSSPDLGDKQASPQLPNSGNTVKKGGVQTPSASADGDVIPAPSGVKTGTK
jgi:hypothetical protein